MLFQTVIYFIYIIMVRVTTVVGWPLKFQIYRNDTTFVLLSYSEKQLHILPDQGTVRAFGKDPTNDTEVPRIPETLFSKFPLGYTLPSLAGYTTADEKMLRQIHTIFAQERPMFIRGIYQLPKYMNPTITKWKGKYLMSWRSSLSTVSFGWIKNWPTATTPNNTILELEDKNVVHYGIRSNDPKNTEKITHLWFNYNQQDTRLLVMSDDNMVISYSVFMGEIFKQAYVRVRIDPKNNTSVGWGNSILQNLAAARSTSTLDSQHQKNWVPFEYNGRLLWLESIYPTHVVEVVNEMNATAHDSKHEAELHTVFRGEHLPSEEANRLHRPWLYYYGLPLRGGTPAIKVRGVYLGFFHTVLMFQRPYKLKTYFMGAYSLCPEPPFKIHAMSQVPIVLPQWYQGAWVTIHTDYVVFPIGLFKDDNDDEHVWLSMGHQDKDGLLLKIHIDELFQRMVNVNEC